MTTLSKEITAATLHSWIHEGAPCQVVDIREAHEVQDGTIAGSTLIPMAEVLPSLHRIATSTPVVICCQSGSRAGALAHVLSADYNFGEVYFLQGGYQAWIEHLRNHKTL